MSRGLATLTAALAALALAATPAAAAPRIAGLARDIPSHGHVTRSYAPRAAGLSYAGGPVLHSNRTHLVFWQPSGSGLTFEPGYMTLIERFLTQVSGDSHLPGNVYGLTGQYRDAFGPAVYASSYGGAVLDTDPLPPSQCTEPSTGPGWSVCVTDDQLENELQRTVTSHRLPTTATDVYFIVTPNGLGDCTDTTSSSCALGGADTGYCGYHSETLNGLLYAVIPYNAVGGHCQSDNPRPNRNPADPTISTISHEHNEVITDPEGDGWLDSAGEEDGDLCIQSFGPNVGGSGSSAWNEVIHGGHYYLQEEWSNDDHGCAPRDEYDRISFVNPSRAQAGKRLAFTAHAVDPDGAIAAYDWFFGAGPIGHHRTTTHVYTRSGVYRVVLRTTNRAGNWTMFARTLRLTRAPARH